VGRGLLNILFMAFLDEIVRRAWINAGEKCERCYRELLWNSRGLESEYGWEAHHRNADGPDSLDNCEILCQECHKNTQSYGG